MEVQFVACDKNSGDGHTRTVTVNTKEELSSEWQKFCESVPYTKWYPDNMAVHGTPEQEAWLEELN